MSNLYPFAKLLWSLTAAGSGTTLSAAGNSGNWAGNGAGDLYPAVSAETAIDLRDSADVALMVTVGGVTGTPALIVSLDIFDDLGNAFAGVLSTTSLAAAGSETVAGGLHGGSSYLVLPRWARVSWAGLTSASVTGTEIALYGR
jgi:hypothetical protein